VVTDKKKPPRGGRFLEILGFFNPLTKEKKLKKERVKYWLSVGAQPSPRVHNLLIEEKIITGGKIAVHKKAKKGKEEEKKETKETSKKEEKAKETKEETKEEKKEEVKEEPKKEENPNT